MNGKRNVVHHVSLEVALNINLMMMPVKDERTLATGISLLLLFD